MERDAVPFSAVRRLVRVDAPDRLRPRLWDRSAPRDSSCPEFLSTPFLDEALRYLGADAEIADVVRRTAARVRADPRLVRLCLHLKHLFLDRGDYHDHFYRYAVEVPLLGDCAGMLPLLPLLAGIPRLQATHRKLRIPRQVVVDTLLDIPIWMRHNRRAKGRWGFDEIGWLLLHFGGTLYRLGRLEFATDHFHGRVHVFRHRRDGTVVLLSAAGVIYRADGRVDGTNGVKDSRGRWTARMSRRGGAARGHPISLTACALKEPVTLPLRAWQEVLKPGDPILDMHIPAGLPLDESAALASCDRAPAFFRARFPHHRFKALVCYGWLLDAAFQQMLPPVANMFRFQNRYHLYPIRGSDHHSLHAIFGRGFRTIATAPRDTALRRNTANFYASGGRLLGSGGGIWKDHLAE